MELSEARRRAEPALAVQRREIAGDDSPNHALGGLRAAPPSTVIDLVEALRAGDEDERVLAARLLTDSTLDGTQILDQCRAALEVESSPRVRRWLATALGHARRQDAIADLVTLVSDDHPPVPFAVAGSLSQCAEGIFESIGDPLLALSSHPDDDVRWSAAFELGEWLAVSDDRRIRARLIELVDDPSSEVRVVARRAVHDSGQN